VEKYGRAGQAKDDIIIRRRKDAIFMPGNWGKNKDMHSEYEILIAFARQHCLRERPFMLGYTYIVCLVLPLSRPGMR
jgi:hypothetical protein